MVKFGIGEMSSVMNTASKNMLKGVFTDMCTYTTSVRTEERKDEKGRTYKVDILEVNVVLKYYWDMVTEYTFNQGQIEMLEQMIYY